MYIARVRQINDPLPIMFIMRLFSYCASGKSILLHYGTVLQPFTGVMSFVMIIIHKQSSFTICPLCYYNTLGIISRCVLIKQMWPKILVVWLFGVGSV